MPVKGPKNPWTLAAARGGTYSPQPRQTILQGEQSVLGMDARTEPDRLKPGYVQHISNGFPDGAGGVIGRGGFTGQFTTPLGGALWTPTIAERAGATTRIVFASGGKLYYTAVGSTTYTEIQIDGATSFAFVDSGEQVRMVRDGAYIYGIEGGATGRLFRVDVTSGGTWTAEIVGNLDEVQSPESRLVLHATQTCQLEGAYQWRVRALNSSTAAYPPTGGSADAGEAVYFTDQLVVQPSSATVRGNKTNAVQLSFYEPAVTTGITHYSIERRGGSLGLEDWRVVAVVQRGVNSSTTTLATASTVSGYLWDATTAAPLNAFYDMVADDDLSGPSSGSTVGTTVKLGEYPPVGAADIAVHSGRLWLAQGNVLWASWLLTYDPLATGFGLAWTTTIDPSAGDYLTQGASFTIGGEGDTDSIVALSQAQAEATAGDYGGVLIAFRQNSHTFIAGDNPENWQADPGRVGEFYGCLSPRGIANVEGQWIYQSPRGVQQLVTNGPPKYLGEVGGQFPMEPYLAQDTLLNATGFRRIAYQYYNRQLWAFSPAVSGSTNLPVYVWNARTNGWSLLQSGTGAGFTGAVVLSTETDTGQMFLAGTDGQLYKHDPTVAVDKATPAAGGTSYSLALISAKYGQRSGEGKWAAFAESRPFCLRFDIERGTGASTLTWAVTNDSSVSTTNTYTLATGRNTREETNLSDVRGATHEVSLTISAAEPGTRIAGFSLGFAEQAIRRG